MQRPEKETIARRKRNIRGIGRFEHARVVVCIVSQDAEPGERLGLKLGACAKRSGSIGVEKFAEASIRGKIRGRASGRRRKSTWRPTETECRAHEVAKFVAEKCGGQFHAIACEHLIHSGVERVAALRPQAGIAGKARIGVEGLNEIRLLDAKSVRAAQA